MSGTIASIHIADVSAADVRSVQEVEIVVGKGVVGDRHYVVGDSKAGLGREVTLIAAEEVERFNAEFGFDFDPGEMRRNVVTRGVSLNDLVDVEFRLGGVTLRGVRLCEPCNHLAQILTPRVMTALVHRAGLRAAVVEGGTIRVGDVVESGLERA